MLKLSKIEVSICVDLLQNELEDCQRIVKRAQTCNVPEIEKTFKNKIDSVQNIISKFQRLKKE